MPDKNNAAIIVEPVLRRSLQPFGLEHLEIVDSIGHDGDPIVLATARYRVGAPKLQPRALLDAIVEATARLSESGDNRALIVRNAFSDGVTASDDFKPRPATRRRKTAST